MRISIITVTYNSEATIEDTIKSVLNQTYNDIEYIIIDGGSEDRTLNIINKYKDSITKLITEPDEGIYDAMNKGLKLATGEIVGFLNSDDLYSNPNVINRVIKEFTEKKVDSVYGDLIYVDRNDITKVVRYWKSSPYRRGLFKKGWHPPHPTFFVRREIYEKYGKFRLDFKLAADYELMLRFLEKYKISSSYIPEVLVKMRVGGESNKSIVNILKANYECYKAWRVNNLSASSLLPISKVIRKLPQFLIK